MLMAMKTKIRFALLISFVILAAIPAVAQERWLHVYYQTVKKAPQPNTSLMIPFSGGGYLGAGPTAGSAPVIIWRADKHGNLLWIKEYWKTGFTWRLLDNGGGTFTFIVPGGIFTCDASGNPLTHAAYSLSDGGMFTDFARGSNGDLYVLNMYLSLMRVDGTTGAPLWTRDYDPAPTSFGIQATPDGGVVLGGATENIPNGTELIKVDADGNLQWAHRYESPSTQPAPTLAATAEGSLLLALQDSNGGSILMRLDTSGNILWQEELTYPDYPAMGPAIIHGIKACADGTILLWGLTGTEPGGQYPSEQPFLEALDASGTPIWCQIYGSKAISPDSGVYAAIPSSEGYVFASVGRDEHQWPYQYGPSLSSVDLSGAAPETCPSQALAVAARPTAFAVLPAQLTIRDWPGSYSVPYELHPVDVQGIRDDLICGDAFPAILTGTKLQDPFRLKLTGWNFQEGSAAFINGVQAPSATYKGKDAKTSQTKMVIGGGNQLKALLPKGQPVCITIQNPDGHSSDCFTFTR